MPSIVHVLALLGVALLIAFSCTQGAEYKIDVTVFDSSPLVGANSNEQYRVYLTWESRDATVTEIGRSSNTGTGEVGRVYEDPDSGDRVPDGHGLPTGTSIDSREAGGIWRRLDITFPMSTDSSRIGVFYAKTVLGSDSLTIPIVKMSETATITPNDYTKTIGIGESITFSVTSTISNNLRWVHNNGVIITAWNDLTDVTIGNVRLADAGIYECFEDGKREMGQHAILRLIVRACPSPKYGPDCSNNCRTCWNGGVCAADNGLCLCQPGFSGDSCDQRLGSNMWGAKGSLFCSARGGNCGTALFCGPDPIGCSCVAGYKGLDCSTPCPSGWYGANCNRQCHCDSFDCDPAIGCREGSTCDGGYRDSQCQGTIACEQGYFGAQCEFVCHCQGGGGCSKIAGVCSNGACDYGWGGTDCQKALPYFYEGGQVTVNVTSTPATIIWNAWNKNIDYGTGPVDHYRVKYWSSDSTFTSAPFQTSTEAFLTITDLSPETFYNFAVAAVRSNSLNAGPFGDEAFAVTGCGAPQRVRNLKAVSISISSILVSWDESSSSISDFTVRYRLLNRDQCIHVEEMSTVKNIDGLNTTIIGLESYSTYSIAVYETSCDQLGDEEKLLIATMETAPSGSPTNVKYAYNKDQLRISFKWKPPPCGERHGDILNYEYEFKQLLLSNSTFSDTLSGITNNPSTSFVNIQSDVICSFRVRASTSKGDGPFTTWENCMTAETSGSTNYLLVAITVPLSILTVVVVFAVLTLLIYFEKCTFLKCAHKSGEDISRSPRRPHSTEGTDHDNDGYAELNRSTLEPPQHYMEPDDDQNLEPMAPRSMKAKKLSSKENKGRKEREESETYEEIDV